MRQKHDEFPDHKFPHTLRHTIATFMIRDKVPISDVSGALGLACQSTTLNINSKVIKGTKKEALSVYESDIKKIAEAAKQKDEAKQENNKIV